MKNIFLTAALAFFAIRISSVAAEPAPPKPLPRFAVQSYAEESQGVEAVCFSPNGKWLVSAGRDGLIRIYSVERKKIWKILGEHTGWVKALAFSPDGKWLASGGSDKAIKIWDALIWKSLTTIQDHERAVTALAFSPDGNLLASASDDRTVRIWDPVLGKKIKTLKKHDDEVRSVSFSPDGKWLASGSADFKVKVWETEEWKQISELGGIPDVVESVAFSPDGKILAAVWSDAAGVWSARSGKHLRTIRAGKGLKSLSFVPGSSILACAGGDRSIHIFNGETGSEIRTLGSHAEPIQAIAFSPAGRYLASGSMDSDLKIWEALHAYVIESSAVLKNSGGALMQLPQGSDVQVLEFKDSSVYVQVKDNLKGWLQKSDISFEKPDTRAPFIKLTEKTVYESSLTVKGAAYDDNRVQSVYMGETFFSRLPGEVNFQGFGDVFPFEETVAIPAWTAPAIRVIDQYGKEFELKVSTSAELIDFKPRYGSLWVQEKTALKAEPSAASATVKEANAGEVLGSIGHKGEWYLLQDGSWVHWMTVLDKMAPSGVEEEKE